MNYFSLVELIKRKRSFLCVGLDSDVEKLPVSMHQFDDPVFEFNKRIIDATLPFAVAYKPNLAFYESSGARGFQSLEKTMQYIRSLNEEVFTIADAKRGDIGNTATQYAKAFFDTMDFDAITINPYMGVDSIEPFLVYPGKWAIVLGLTSNKGANDFQMLQTVDNQSIILENQPVEELLFEKVIEKVSQRAGTDQLMVVVGATKAELMKKVRRIVPETFLLVPGVGAQGGNLAEVAQWGMTKDCGLLVNASRSVIFASSGVEFANEAASEASKLQVEMEKLLKDHHILTD